MKSSLKDKTNQQKWYAPKQRFSIRKYHFGAASVLLGISLAVIGGEVAEATEITSTSTSESSVVVEATEPASVTISTDTVSPETAVAETVVTEASSSTDATEATISEMSTTETSATETVASTTETATVERTATIAYIIQYVLEDGTVISVSADTTSVTTTDAVAKATVNLSANLPTGYELAAGQVSALSQEVTEGASNTVTFKVVKKVASAPTSATTSSTEAAKSETTTAASSETATTESTKASQETSQDASVAAAKEVLEQVTSEAAVLANEADRIATTTDSDTTTLKAAAAATKLTVTEATTTLGESAASLEQVNAQIDAVRSNVEALALELRKYSKDGEIEVRLAVTTLNDPQLTVVKNVQSLTNEEIAAIIQAVKNANPTLTSKDTIDVVQTATSGYAGGVTVYFNGNKDKNEGSASIAPTDVIIGTTGAKNVDQLTESINWFDFTTASIEYSDGTKVGALTGYDSGSGIPIRQVTYTDGTIGSTTDAKFQKLGVAKYVNHIYYTGGTANKNRLYEVLQEGMKFVVPTKVEGYELTATVKNLGSKEVATDPNQLADGTSTNAMFEYGDWTEADVADYRARYTKYMAELAANPGKESSIRQTAFTHYFVKVTTVKETNTATGATTTKTTATNAAGGTNNQVNTADMDAMNALTDPTTTTTVTTSGTTRTETTVRYKKVLRGSEGAYVQNINRYGSTEAEVILMDLDSQWAYMKTAGLVPEKFTGLIGFGASVDTSNVGVTFELSASYFARPVDVNVIATDAESAGTIEFVQFESNGTPWEDFMTVGANDGINVPKSITQDNLKGTRSLGGAGYDPKQFTDVTTNSADMYGKQTFGPVTSGESTGLAVGISENVSELSIYIASAGTQQAAIGFVIYDAGDAHPTYGTARHLIGDFTTIQNENGVNKQTIHTQPYLGNTKGDPDFQNVEKDKAYWTLDDVVYTEKYTETVLQSGVTVTNADGQQGTYTITANNNAVLTFTDGSTKKLEQGEVIKTLNADGVEIVGVYNASTKSIGVGALPDEGENQLLDENVSKEYNIRRASDTQFVMEGIEAHLGQNNSTAYIRGWVDFDGNGKFDLYEASDVVTVAADGTYNLVWNNVPQLLDTSQDNAGVRVRIGLTETEILTPTGTASSGEVEDFQAHVTHLPRGTENESSDVQDRNQSISVSIAEFFSPRGKEEPNFSKWVEIDTNIAPKIVVNDSVVAEATPTGKTVNVTDLDDNTVYIGPEVTIKDANGNVLGTAIQVTNPYSGRVEYLLSEYTEYDKSGNLVGVYTLNKEGVDNKYIVGYGAPTISIDFDPAPGFVGEANGIVVRGWDTNGNSTGWEATRETLQAALGVNPSLTDSEIYELSESEIVNPNLTPQDMIRKNVNTYVNEVLSMDSTYIPTVIDVVPNGEDTTSRDKQGVTQTGTPSIPRTGTVQTIDGTKVEYPASSVILDETKPVVFASTDQEITKFETDTTATEPMTITLSDGTRVQVEPDAIIPSGTSLPAGMTVTGKGGVIVDKLWLPAGSEVPAGSTLTARDVATAETTVLRNGEEVVIPAGQYIEVGDVLTHEIISKSNNRYNDVALGNGYELSSHANNSQTVLDGDTRASDLIAIDETFTVGNNSYTAKDSFIPAGSSLTTETPLVDLVLPDATHLDPVTGAVTKVPRSYTKISDTEIVIENEGTYTLNQDTLEVTFTPHPKFVGVGTGVEIQQPDVDYNDVVDSDPVTLAYGTDYGRARYTPTVDPSSEATITRTVHYVFDNDKDPSNNALTPVSSFDESVVVVDNEAVTKTQTLTFKREISLDASGNLVLSDWIPINDANATFGDVISPTIPGYTANVIPVEHRAANNHDVGTFTPDATTVTSDDTDNIDVYVVYTPNKEYAVVKYWDVYTGEAVELKTETVNDDATLSGTAGETIQYLTAQDIAAFEAAGYQLVYDEFTRAEPQFDSVDDASSTDPSQVYNVYFTHKIEQEKDLQTETVTRTIKYVDEKGNPALDEKGNPIPDHVETLTFTREVFVDKTLAADDPSRTTYGQWTTTDNKFDTVVSPESPGYTTLNKIVEGSVAIDPEGEDQTVVVVYKPIVDVEVPPTVKPTDKVPETEDKKTYGELGLVEQVTLTVKHVYADGTPVLEDKDGNILPKGTPENTPGAKPVTKEETLTYTRTVKLDGNTGEVIEATYGEWTPASQDFKAISALDLTDYVPSISEVTRTGVVATDKDSEAIIIYRTGVKVVDPKDPDNNPDTPTPTDPVKPTDPVPNDPKGRTYGELGLVEEVKRTIHYVYADGKTAAEDVVETVTFVRSVQIDAVTGDIIADTYTPWTTTNDTFPTVTSPEIAGYTPTKSDVKEQTVTAETADIVETIIYNTVARVVDPTDPTIPTNPDKPVTPDTPVPNDPKGRTYGDLGLVEEVTLTVNHVYADGTPVLGADGKPVVSEETLTFTRTVQIDVETGDIIADTYSDWTPATQNFTTVNALKLDGYTPSKSSVEKTNVTATDKDATETIIYRTGVTVVDPKDPDNNPDTPTPETPVTPDTPVPNDPKGRTYGELGLVEEVTLTVNHVYADGTPVLGADGKPVVSEETLTFTRTVQVDAVTGDIIADTYSAWTPATQNFTTVNALVLDGYTASKSSVEKTNVTATDKDTVETIIYRTGVSVVDPKDPDNNPDTPTPTDPVKPTDPVPNDPKGRTYGELGLVEEVTLTVNHVYADGTPVLDADGKPVVSEETLTFTRTVQIDAVTGDIIADTYSAWAPATQDFTTVNALTLDKFTPSTDKVEKTGITATDKDITATIVYRDNVDVVDPKDPVTPDTPVPNDPKGRTYGELGLVEEVTRTVVHLYSDGSPVLDDKGQPVVTTQTVTFTRTVQIDAVTGDIIANTYTDWTPATQTFAEVSALTKDDVAKLENYKPSVEKVDAVTVKATDADLFDTIVYRTTSTTITTPTDPTTPVGPNTPVPNDPKGRTYGELGLIEEVTRTIHYVYTDGSEAAKDVVEKVTFVRSVQIDAVTGDIIADSYTPWTSSDDTFDKVTSPEIAGFTPSATEVGENKVTATSADIVETVIYVDPTEGSQVAVTHFVDEDGNGVDVSTVEAGEEGTPLTKKDEILAKIKELEAKGYEVVSNNYPAFDNDATNDVFDTVLDGSEISQVYQVVVRPAVIPVNPEDPDNNPNTPDTPAKPDDKVPGDPEGRTYADLGLIESVTRTITYYYNNGEPVLENGQPKVVTQTVNFYRTAQINKVTGEVTITSDWTAPQTLVAVDSPVIAKFLADKATVGEETVAYNAADLTEKVVYSPLGSWVPQLPTGEKPVDPSTNTPVDPIVYPNDPTDPTKPGTETPTVPYIPGHTPVDPSDPTKPLTPVDPEDPTKGYVVPPVPSTPGEDTPITYVPNVPANPEDPDNNPTTPNIPANPDDKVPNDPKGRTYGELGLIESVTRTITYRYADGKPVLENGVAKVVTQTVNFYRTAILDGVTGDVISMGDWTAPQTLVAVDSPVIDKFLADKATVGEETVAYNAADLVEEVVYTPLGSWVPQLPTGEKPVDPSTNTPVDPIVYPNDPNDPTKPGTETPTVPYIPGHTPVDPTDPTKPLTPVDPEDPTKGYVVPPVPTNPGTDTPITYVPNVPAVPVDPDNDPKTPPANPDDKVPNDPKDRTYGELGLIENVTRTITYVYEDGTPVRNEDGTPKVTTQTVTFYRTALIDGVTGEVIKYGEWTAPQTLEEVVSPVVSGYVADKSSVPATTVAHDAADATEKVVYSKLGSYVPVIPDGTTPSTPATPTPYPNDPTDPTKPGTPGNTKPGTDVPTIPHVPGYVPVDPNGNPLKPVDPTDPSKGYIAPPVPSNPGTDTPINYVPEESKVVVRYVDENGNDLVPSENILGKVGDDYTTSGKVINGYILEKVEGNPSGKIPSGGTTVTYVYKKIGSYVPVIPDGTTPSTPATPTPYPNDPTDPTKPGTPGNTKPGTDVPTIPHVPGHVPVDPNGNPLKPIDPNDPTKGYEVPPVPSNPGTDTPINYVPEESKVVVRYVDENGNDLVPSENIPGKVGDDYTTSGKVINGYILEKVEGNPSGKIPSGGTTVTYVYKKLGSWVPNIPGQPTDPIVYPNDPTDPSKPGTDVPTIPHVPGYVPVDPNGEPLKPVDPTDPSKGYIAPPVPSNPGEDTPINYVPEESKVVVRYVDENGNDLVPSENIPGKVGDDYTTSGKVINGYILEKVEGTPSGKIPSGGTTVTY
ncbi:TPA: MucBP domain-containing protein, partial [Streptococcus suis]